MNPPAKLRLAIALVALLSCTAMPYALAQNHNPKFDVSDFHISGSDYVFIPPDEDTPATPTKVKLKYRNNDNPTDGSTELKWESGDKIDVYESSLELTMPKTWSSSDQGEKDLELKAHHDATDGSKQTLQAEFTNADSKKSPIGEREFTLLPVEISRDEEGGAEEWKSVDGPMAKALPGQKMNLKFDTSKLPQGMSVANYQWTITGGIFSDYSANNAIANKVNLAPSDLTGQEINFYWSQP
jgi:hypothetical protein